MYDPHPHENCCPRAFCPAFVSWPDLEEAQDERIGFIMDGRRSGIDCLLVPRSFAVIGATAREGSVGRTIINNLATGWCRKNLYAVNPKHQDVLGVRCYKDIASVPEQIDLALIATPAPTVPEVIAECVRSGVRAAVVISAGFKERGAEGAQLEQLIRQQLVGSYRSS